MTHRIRTILIGLALGVVLIVVGAIVVVDRHSANTTAASSIDRSAPAEIAAATNPSSQTLDQLISGLQARLATTPKDDVSWATLGLAYVQQAKVTVDPSYYPKADGAIARSRAINGRDNYLANLGQSAVASARHDFAGAKSAAEQGLQINSYSPLLYGALSDAEIQLGNYTAGFAAVDTMVSLRPDTASLTRASYAAELRGDVPGATDLMQRALDRAPNASARAFALFYLGELSFNSGDVDAALGFYNRAYAESPLDPAALDGKAKAEAALGQTETAIDHYEELVNRYPEPSYVLEYGELLQSVGRTAEANAQYAVFKATQQLFAANGVEPDSAATLFDAAHGDPRQALVDAELGIATRPFLVMQDAYAWALHVNGRDAEALQASDRALQTGMRNATFHYHAGMIKVALGDEAGARQELTLALQINPHFSPLDAPIAQQALAALPAAATARPG
ncbi:MAG: tetratricopeptide repeat protein [Ilumatobacteraceae bacterium]